jgi:CBS-domain-containing membrane protein
MAKRPALFETSLEKIQVGRFSQLSTALPTFTLYEVLQMIEKTHYSAIPIVDSDGTLIDTLYKADLARIPPGHLLTFLNTSIAQVLRSWREKGLLRTYASNTCTMDASMEVVLTTLMDSRLRSLVVVDSSRHIRGIVALTDILRCFLV